MGRAVPTYPLLINAGQNAIGAMIGPIRGGPYSLLCEGTWGGASVKVERLALNGTDIQAVQDESDVNIVMTQNTDKNIYVAQGARVKLTVTGGNVNTFLNASLAGLG